LPQKLEIRFFHNAEFRLERVAPQDVIRTGPLRQDAKLFRERTAALRKELSTTQRDRLSERENNLISAAYLYRDAALIDRVRKEFDEWIALPADEFATRSFPTHLAYCLATVGDARDFKAFHQLINRHPTCAWRQTWAVLQLAERVGTAKALPLLDDMLKNPEQGAELSPNVKVLLTLDPKVPQPTDGDLFLIAMMERFHLKHSCYGLGLAQQRLVALKDTHPLTDEEVKQWKHAVTGDWLFATEANRRYGVELVREWLKQYEPPAKDQTRTIYR
jgi:hypothetical protein